MNHDYKVMMYDGPMVTLKGSFTTLTEAVKLAESIPPDPSGEGWIQVVGPDGSIRVVHP